MKRATEAYHSASLFEVGIGYVAVARFRGSGVTEVGVFLLDVFCLGAKNAFFTCCGQTEYDRELLDRILPAEKRTPLDPPSARKLVEDAVAYARSLGLTPHPDYKQACRVFGGINVGDSNARFTFGKDGKPLYVQGPHDSFERCQQVLRQLRARCGNDNFNFMVVGGETVIRELEEDGFKIRQKVPRPPDMR